jgi:hypothetical protein
MLKLARGFSTQKQSFEEFMPTISDVIAMDKARKKGELEIAKYVESPTESEEDESKAMVIYEPPKVRRKTPESRGFDLPSTIMSSSTVSSPSKRKKPGPKPKPKKLTKKEKEYEHDAFIQMMRDSRKAAEEAYIQAMKEESEKDIDEPVRIPRKRPVAKKGRY